MPLAAAPNNGMHPTRNTTALIFSRGLGGRVMPGVMAPLRAPAKLVGRLRAIERSET
jgi:hypothetical protein